MTPLSDLIDAHVARNSPQTWIRFLAEFQRSQVGVVVAGDLEPPELDGRLDAGDTVSAAGREIAVGLTKHPAAEGRSLAVAFADPAASAERSGPRFNAAMAGEALLRTVFHNPECDGVLVNSATADVAVVIDRDTTERLVQPAPDDRPAKPWWHDR